MMMNVRKILLAMVAALMLCTQSVAAVQFEVIDQDPETATILALGDRLALRIGYNSKQPLRFRVHAMREGQRLEVGAVTNPATLQPPGAGETLVWIGYTNATHIDALRITALDDQWLEVKSIDVAVDMTWRAGTPATSRTPAIWISALEKTDRRERDYTYDPLPKPDESLLDLFFLISVASLPPYLLIQVQMLRRYRKRWRELAAVPLVSLLPLVLFSLIGFGMDFGLWASFLFRCVPFALAYLLVLWVAKWLRSGKPPVR